MYKLCSYFRIVHNYKPLLVKFPLASAYYGLRTKSNQFGGLIKTYSRTYHPINNLINSNNKSKNKDGNNYTRTGTMMAFTVTGLLLKFLGLEEENEDSELVEVLKRAELAYRVKVISILCSNDYIFANLNNFVG